MRLSRAIQWTCCAIGAVLLGGLTGPAFGQAPAPAAPLTNENHTRMQPEDAPDSTFAVFGLQNAEGFYVVRNRFAPHQTSRPHYHDKDRWVTVIKGTWYGGEGDVFRPETMIPIKAGGFQYHKAMMHHYDGSMDDNEVIVQIMGYGPVKTIQTEVDEKGNPIGANPLNSNPPARGAGAAPAGAAPAGAAPGGRRGRGMPSGR
jgi:hypothetical protein